MQLHGYALYKTVKANNLLARLGLHKTTLCLLQRRSSSFVLLVSGVSLFWRTTSDSLLQ